MLYEKLSWQLHIFHTQSVDENVLWHKMKLILIHLLVDAIHIRRRLTPLSITKIFEICISYGNLAVDLFDHINSFLIFIRLISRSVIFFKHRIGDSRTKIIGDMGYRRTREMWLTTSYVNSWRWLKKRCACSVKALNDSRTMHHYCYDWVSKFPIIDVCLLSFSSRHYQFIQLLFFSPLPFFTAENNWRWKEKCEKEVNEQSFALNTQHDEENEGMEQWRKWIDEKFI